MYDVEVRSVGSDYDFISQTSKLQIEVEGFDY